MTFTIFEIVFKIVSCENIEVISHEHVSKMFRKILYSGQFNDKRRVESVERAKRGLNVTKERGGCVIQKKSKS